MEFNIERETLLSGIGYVLGVVDKRGTLPILSHCLLETNGDGIVISATDLELSFRGFYPAEVMKPGALTVQAGYFSKLIKDLPKGPLALVGMDNACLKIQTGDSHYQLYGLAAEQFPSLPEAAEESLMEMAGSFLQEMILKTIYSVAGEDLQYNLTGIFVEQVKMDNYHWLRLVATDGHRITLVERPLPEGVHLNLDRGILVPFKAMREISRFVEGQAKVTLGLGKETLTLQAADKHLSVRLLDLKFPDYQRIIPADFAHRFSINRRELIGTLKRIAQLSSKRFKGVIFKITAAAMEVSFANPEVGEGREVLSLTLESGELSELPIEMGFNVRYLLEPLQIMASDTVSLEINDRRRPIRVMDKGDPHYFSLVMPLSL